MNIACEQALLFGRAKRVSRERASEQRSREGQRKGRSVCSQAKMNILSIRLQVTPPMTPGRVATFQRNFTGFRGAIKFRGLGSGHKEPFVRMPIQGDYSAQDVHCREHWVFL